MELEILWAVAALSLVNLGLTLALLLRRRSDPYAEGLRRLEQQIREEMRLNRDETAQGLKSLTEAIGRDARENRLELTAGLKGFQETTEARLEKVREVVEGRLKALQEENGRKLEEMRLTVDEKLQASVEKRFNDSFRLISERLDQVHKGLGEMQTLAGGVGDLKRVLTNVKTRGTLGRSSWEPSWSSFWPRSSTSVMLSPSPAAWSGWNTPSACRAGRPASGRCCCPWIPSFPWRTTSGCWRPMTADRSWRAPARHLKAPYGKAPGIFAINI